MKFKFNSSYSEMSIAAAGDLLTEDFQTAQRAMATVEGLKYFARQTEEQALNTIAAVPTRNGRYIDPQDIPEELHDPIAHASVDAHVQKVQAEQVEAYSKNELETLTNNANSKYLRKKVRILTIDKETKPILVYLIDGLTGTQYIGKKHPTFITGIISEIRLTDNILVVRPTITKKLVARSVQHYLVYVINPGNLEPLVNISIG